MEIRYRGRQKWTLNLIVEYYFFYKVGKPIAEWLSKHSKITPNQATWINLMFVVLAVPCFLYNQYFTIVLGGVLVYISGIWDTIDGSLARVKGIQSKRGAWFDGIIDRVGEVLILSAVGLGLYLTAPSLLIIILTIGVIFMQFFFYYANASFGMLHGYSMTPTNEPFFTYCRALFVFIILVGALVNQLFFVLLGFATVGNLYNVFVQRSHWESFKEGET